MECVRIDHVDVDLQDEAIGNQLAEWRAIVVSHPVVDIVLFQLESE